MRILSCYFEIWNFWWPQKIEAPGVVLGELVICVLLRLWQSRWVAQVPWMNFRFIGRRICYSLDNIYSHQFQANIFSVCLGFLIATSEIDSKYCGDWKEGGLISCMGQLVWMSASWMGMWLVRMGMWPVWMGVLASEDGHRQGGSSTNQGTDFQVWAVLSNLL